MANTPPLSEVYRDTNLQLKHTIPLDFDTTSELPESYAWTTENVTSIQKALQVPVLDLTAPNIVDLLKNAAKSFGMFQVTNHGVPQSLVEEVESHARRLFALPSEQKLKALRLPNGATGYGVARISPFFDKQMWHEGFTIMGSSVADHAKELWPEDYQEFCDAMENYQKKMKSLAYNISLLLTKALGVDEHDQEMASQDALQLNSYPCCPNPSRAVGLAPHTDSSLLTILHQNDTIGLQLFQDGVGWKNIPPISGALLVNIGDFMHIISNANFPSAYHRVVPNGTSHRLTVAYFYNPSTDSLIAPLSKLPKFRPVTVKEYIGLKNKHFDKALNYLMI